MGQGSPVLHGRVSSARYSAGKTGDELPSDYLSDATRKVRRALLLACVVGLAYANGFKPTELTALGMKFGDGGIDQSKISWLLIGVMTYFLVEFLTFVRKDYVHLVYGGEQYPVPSGQDEVVPYGAMNDPRYGWEFVFLKLKTPAMFRPAFMQAVPRATRFYTWLLRSRSARLARLGQRVTPMGRPNVVPIPRYGFQSFLDFWFPFLFGLGTILFLWFAGR